MNPKHTYIRAHTDIYQKIIRNKSDKVSISHSSLGTTSNMRDSERPKFSGLYISSAFAGGTTKVPAVVARVVKVNSYTPGHRRERKASARSLRRLMCSGQYRRL
mmetsp:Transcript_22716/g.31775  ORF Transcript_22716/g.31775 Transcript_22716/m.31775 type:complete len:104 (-) Transcript_22716:50-361(-)